VSREMTIEPAQVRGFIIVDIKHKQRKHVIEIRT